MHVWGLLRLAPTIKFQSLTLGDVALARRLSSAESLDDPRMLRRRAISLVTMAKIPPVMSTFPLIHGIHNNLN